MSFSTDWKVDAYKKSFESEDHWQLRRKFMLKHKNKFPEDELVCLAQLFMNIEILGCRYSGEVMKRVAALSEGIALVYRQSRSKKIQPTFVHASDAASSKIKRTLPAIVPQLNQTATEFKYEKDNDILLNDQQLSVLLADIVYFDYEESFQNNIQRTKMELKKTNLGELRDTYDKEEKTLKVYFKDHLIISHCDKTADNKTVSRTGLSKLVELLRKHCYSIKKKKNFSSNEQIERVIGENSSSTQTVLGSMEPTQFEDCKLQENNIGFKMLKSLGWSGGALGADGIVDPIGLKIKIGRRGLGDISSSAAKRPKLSVEGTADKPQSEIDVMYYKNMLQKFKYNDSNYDLVFTPEFNADERAILHKESIKLGLKTKSYGKDSERHLVVRKFINTNSLKQRLLNGDPILLELFDIIPPKII